MSFWKIISPRAAVADFVAQWRRPTEHRWLALGISVLITGVVLYVFLPESERITPRSPDIVYISTFSPDRTQEEIIASNIANQKRKDELAALEEQRAELRKDLYRELGRATGLDVDAMEAKIEEDRAAELAAQRTAKEESAE
jgi:hypothetical protein